MRSWADICDDKSLRDLPYKIEQDRWGRLIMSPVKPDHSEFQAEIAHLLRLLLPDWKVLVECAIETAEGIRAADVAAMPAAARAGTRGAASLARCPEICVEVLSECNTDEEMVEKRQLFAARGSGEFWTCGPNGLMTFRLASDGSPLSQSRICPQFLLRINCTE